MRVRTRQILIAVSAVFVFAMPSLFAVTGEMAHVEQVVNGNTLAVTFHEKHVQVRLLGVATPDPDDRDATLQKLGSESVEFLKSYLSSGWVYLEFPSGKAEPNAEGVVEAYVYRGRDGAFVNERVITEGFGIMNRKVKFTLWNVFDTEEQTAKKRWRGIWNPYAIVTGKEAGSGFGNSTNLGQAPPCRYCSESVMRWIYIYSAMNQ